MERKSQREWRLNHPEYRIKYYHSHPNKMREYRQKLRQNYPLYSTWSAMKQRCYNSNRPRYKDWGGRGIVVCEKWLDYKVFEKWCLDNGWQLGLTIDRINENGNYCPENCHIITRSENSAKKRVKPPHGVDGKFVTKQG
jgi:hypothetical protein